MNTSPKVHCPMAKTGTLRSQDRTEENLTHLRSTTKNLSLDPGLTRQNLITATRGRLRAQPGRLSLPVIALCLLLGVARAALHVGQTVYNLDRPCYKKCPQCKPKICTPCKGNGWVCTKPENQGTGQCKPNDTEHIKKWHKPSQTACKGKGWVCTETSDWVCTKPANQGTGRCKSKDRTYQEVAPTSCTMPIT